MDLSISVEKFRICNRDISLVNRCCNLPAPLELIPVLGRFLMGICVSMSFETFCWLLNGFFLIFYKFLYISMESSF